VFYIIVVFLISLAIQCEILFSEDLLNRRTVKRTSPCVHLVTIFAIGTDIFVTGCASTYSLEQWFSNCGPWTTGGSLLSAGGFRRKISAKIVSLKE
jgi:hypothetical protein